MFIQNKPKAVRDHKIEEIVNYDYFKKSGEDEDEKKYEGEFLEKWQPKFEVLKDYYAQYKKQQNAKKITK